MAIILSLSAMVPYDHIGGLMLPVYHVVSDLASFSQQVNIVIVSVRNIGISAAASSQFSMHDITQ